jgi:prevent-host-death family protein
MKTVNIQAAKTHLSRLVEEAAAGEEIVIAKAGKPLVKLTPFAPAQAERKLGFLAGKGWEAPDCWAEDSETEALFYGSPVEPPAMRVAEEEPS